MSEYFKSAFSNISSQLAGSASSASDYPDQQENPFVGQTVELKGQKIRIEKVIAEGGFGFVFKVRDVESQKVYALKRLIASDKESKEEIENEIQVLQDLQPHPHIMKFISWGIIQQKVYLLLSEFCGCGSLQDLKLPITNIGQINRITYQTCLALERMHQINLIHRDLKIENILFDNDGFVKLCDFGSVTSKSFYPDHDWTPIQRSLVEDEMQRHTTPMYRPPEILDTYLHYAINTSMDIWALGCLIFTIKFGRHPFEDSAKLRIINCNYNIPVDAPQDVQVQIIKSCLKVDPNDRLRVDDVIKMLEDNFVDLKSPCVEPRLPSPMVTVAPVNPQPVQPLPNAAPGSAAPAGQSFGFSGFTKYLKDTSSKVMQTVNTLQTNAFQAPRGQKQPEAEVESPTTPVPPPRTHGNRATSAKVAVPEKSSVPPPRPTPPKPKVVEGSLISLSPQGDPNPKVARSLEDDPLGPIAQGMPRAASHSALESIFHTASPVEESLISLASESDPISQLVNSLPTPKIEPLKPQAMNGSLKPVPASQGMPRPASLNTLQSATRQTFSAPRQPDYSRSHFVEPKVTVNPSGVNPKVTANHFEDLLGDFTRTTCDTSNMTVGQLKKVEMLKAGYDPIQLKVREWKENKTRNIRALLGSLDTIVWESCKWQPVGMHQLVESSDVRRYYLKACLAVHPDKLRGDPNEELAKLIFVELNDAWSEFEKQSKI